MKEKLKENKKIIGSIVIFCIVLAFATVILLQRKNIDPIINADELNFVLEFDENKQNKETDEFIKKNIEEYFIEKDKEIIVKDLDYNLTKVSEGVVVELKDDETKIDDESIKRFIKHDHETKKPISNTDIQDINKDDYFIGKVVSEDDIEIEFQYRVFDTDFPIIKSDDEFELTLNSEDEFKKTVSASDRVEGELKVETEGSIDWNKEGTYDLVLKANDRNGNVSQKEVKLTLIEEKEKEETIVNVEPNRETNSAAEYNGGNAGTKPQPKPNPKPQAKPDPKPQAKPDSKPQAKPDPKPQPKPDPKPVEDDSWKRHPKDFIGANDVKRYFYKNYGNFEGCHAVADDLLDEMNWNGNWNSTFCDSNGDLYYSEY